MVLHQMKPRAWPFLSVIWQTGYAVKFLSLAVSLEELTVKTKRNGVKIAHETQHWLKIGKEVSITVWARSKWLELSLDFCVLGELLRIHDGLWGRWDTRLAVLSRYSSACDGPGWGGCSDERGGSNAFPPGVCVRGADDKYTWAYSVFVLVEV